MADNTHHDDLKAAVQAVRDELDAVSGWSDTGVTDAYLKRRIERRAYPLVANRLADGNDDWVLPTLETLLAGHYVLASGDDAVRQADSETDSDGARRTYAGDRGEGLRSTTLGQQAVELDESGRLAQMADSDGEAFVFETY